MKSYSILLFCLVHFMTSAVYAQDLDTLEVSGNCGMCQHRIETSALTVSGVDTAVWWPHEKFLTISYECGVNKELVRIEVAKAVAGIGHDNELFQATKDSYNSLHGCCRYDRRSYSKYSCPAHPKITSDKKKACSVCNKVMIKRK